MTHLVRWDPFSEVSSLRHAMDRFFEDFVPTRPLRTGDQAELSFPVDVSETEGEVVVKAVLPGIKPDDVDITISEGVLTVRGQSRQEATEEKENFYHREIRFGAFSRSLPLPTRVNQDQADASFDDGILTIRLPKVEEARPRQIKVSGARPQVESQAQADGSVLTGSGSQN